MAADAAAELAAWVAAAAPLVRSLPPATRHVWLGNYVELLAAEAVGVEAAPSLWRVWASCSLTTAELGERAARLKRAKKARARRKP